MIRATKACMIIKKEVEIGLIEVKLDPTNKFKEYWVYEDITSGTINSATGHYEQNSSPIVPERTLKCVVVCENEDSHIVKDLEKHFMVKGFIFNDKEYPDLTDYLGKTERHL